MAKIHGIIPIDWFGNRNEYEQSDIRIVTVGLNPSEMEFKRDKNDTVYDVSYRFPNAIVGNPATYPQAWNEYFMHHPYNWFCHFERVLQGAGASYGGKLPEKMGEQDHPGRRAIHTDLCSPYATAPAWSKLPSKEQEAITKEGICHWKEQMEQLQPDIIITAIAKKYWQKLPVTDISELYVITETQNGTARKRPVVIRKGNYNGALVILGVTQNKPFGSICKEEQKHIGELILQAYKEMKRK